MVSGELTRIDWNAPWFGAIGEFGRSLAGCGDFRSALDRHAARLDLRVAGDRPLRFAPADAAGREPYEAYIARTGRVPTRDTLHDAFGALVWLRFPRTKARLNALQAADIALRGARGTRGPLRDAATLIDENGLLLVTCRGDLIDAIRRRNWNRVFVADRAAWAGEVRPIAFGHALLEKLMRPYKAITAHTVTVPLQADASLPEIDAWLAGHLDAGWTPQRLLPLPVLGIPGWCAANEDPRYYDDAAVFRPGPGRTAA